MNCLKNLVITSVLLSSTAIMGWAGNPRGNDPGYDNYSERVEAGVILSDHGAGAVNGYIRVDAFPLSVNIGVPSFLRLAVRPGFSWVDGFWKGDVYIPGYYRPTTDRGRNWAWVPGHWGGDRWLPGHWRPSQRSGYEWIEGHWTREGEWVEGFWNPRSRAPRGMVWEPGYWSARGWVEGFWRVAVKPGFFWIGGDWDGDRWVSGRWERAAERHVWQRRYWNTQEGRWYPGQLIKLPDNHQGPIKHGHYSPRGEWVFPYDRGGGYGEHHEERYRSGDRNLDRDYRTRRSNRPSEQEQLETSRREREGRPTEQEQLNTSRREREGTGGQVQKIESYAAPVNQSQPDSRSSRSGMVSGAAQGQPVYQNNRQSEPQSGSSEGGQLRKLEDSKSR